MKGKIHWIGTNGDYSVVPADEPPTLGQMQAFVKGYIETMTVTMGKKPEQLIINEEGRMKGLPPNRIATQIVQASYIVNDGIISDAQIVGPAILLQGIRME